MVLGQTSELLQISELLVLRQTSELLPTSEWLVLGQTLELLQTSKLLVLGQVVVVAGFDLIVADFGVVGTAAGSGVVAGFDFGVVADFEVVVVIDKNDWKCRST